jgi:predicted ATPase
VANDRITQIRIEGLRSLERVPLDLGRFTVLIGRNATGKSTLVEALALLGHMGDASFFDRLNHVHGGLGALLRFGASRLRLGVTIQGEDGTLRYDLALVQEGGYLRVDEERLADDGPEPPVFLRNRGVLSLLGADLPLPALRVLPADRLLLHTLQGIPPALLPYVPEGAPVRLGAVQRMARALAAIEVHPPLEVAPMWAARATGRTSALRQPSLLEPAERLGLFGGNLANLFHALKNDFGEEHWQETLEYVRLALGDEVESVNTRSEPGGGSLALRVKYRYNEQQVPAWALSDGTLACLAVVALCRMPSQRSVLAVDDIEACLHPSVQTRMVDFFQDLAERQGAPVLFSTHSDRLLDALSDPAGQVVLCELDGRGATQLLRPDPDLLARWLSRYRGLGEIRGDGHLASVMRRMS